MLSSCLIKSVCIYLNPAFNTGNTIVMNDDIATYNHVSLNELYFVYLCVGRWPIK